MEQKTWMKIIEGKNGVIFLEIILAVLRRTRRRVIFNHNRKKRENTGKRQIVSHKAELVRLWMTT